MDDAQIMANDPFGPDTYLPTEAGERTKRLHSTTDAMVWADEFMAVNGGVADEVDMETMIGWFANAIEVGRSAGISQERARTEDVADRPAGDSEPYEPILVDADSPEQAIFMALGAASLCWAVTPRGLFDSTRARDIGNELCRFLAIKQDHPPTL